MVRDASMPLLVVKPMPLVSQTSLHVAIQTSEDNAPELL